MTDLLDRRIRTLMMHVADASPEAPGTDKIEARRAAHQRPLSHGATPSELLLERRPARAAGHVTERRLPPTHAPLRTRPRWVVAFVAAVVVVALVGGIALLVQSPAGEGPPVITQPPAPTTTIPTPTTTTPTTVPAALISAPSYAEVPSFTGVVQYYQHDPALADPGWQATVSVSFAGPMRYEVEVIAEEGGPLFLGGAGKVFLGDGTLSWLKEFEDMPFSVLSDFDHFRHFYYDSDWPSPAWDEICAVGGELLGTEPMLGRTVTHLACATTAENYELWVDEESGLVLRMAGPISIGDYHPSTARDGGFTFTELTLEPVIIPDPPDVPTAQTGEFPPFHMIRGATGVPALTTEYWYRDAGTLRETFIDAVDAEYQGWIGTFTLIANGRLAGCSEGAHCYNVPMEDASDIFPRWMPYWQLPLSLVEESCTEVSQDVVAGRPARHFVCDGVDFPSTGLTWSVATDPGYYSEYWYDAETGLAVKEVRRGYEMEVTLLEVNPAFPVGIFVYEELVFPSESDTG